MLTQFEVEFLRIIFNGFKMLPNSFLSIFLCNLLGRDREAPLPLHKAVFKQTIWTFMESNTQQQNALRRLSLLLLIRVKQGCGIT